MQLLAVMGRSIAELMIQNTRWGNEKAAYLALCLWPPVEKGWGFSILLKLGFRKEQKPGCKLGGWREKLENTGRVKLA